MNKAMQFKVRIKNLATRNHVPAQAVLQTFMLERLLERISQSRYKDMIVLKGGVLIASLVGISSRTTMDMDATLRGYPLSEETIQSAFAEICAITLDDEVAFVLNHTAPIREDDEYGGYRVALVARYESINTSLKIDITTGDIITPAAVRYIFHSNFETKDIEVWAYPIETILAEKIETILRRSVLNTRPRDFYDVYILMKNYQLSVRPEVLSAALLATCDKRGSLGALERKDAILLNIEADQLMRQRWDRYQKDNSYASGITFEDVLGVLRMNEIIQKHPPNLQ